MTARRRTPTSTVKRFAVRLPDAFEPAARFYWMGTLDAYGTPERTRMLGAAKYWTKAGDAITEAKANGLGVGFSVQAYTETAKRIAAPERRW